MEFGKVKGFWTKSTAANGDAIKSSSITTHNTNNNNNDAGKQRMDTNAKVASSAKVWLVRNLKS